MQRRTLFVSCAASSLERFRCGVKRNLIQRELQTQALVARSEITTPILAVSGAMFRTGVLASGES
jgi:hypothetical protein